MSSFILAETDSIHSIWQVPGLEWGQPTFTHETNERAVDGDKDAHPALNKKADSCSSSEALRKHCFPSGCACQPLLYQEGLLLLILTFKSLSLTSVCTGLGVHFTAGTGDGKQFNVQYLVGKPRVHLWTLAARQCRQAEPTLARRQLILPEIHIRKVRVEYFAHWLLHMAPLPEDYPRNSGVQLGRTGWKMVCFSSSLIPWLLSPAEKWLMDVITSIYCSLTSIRQLSS